jgi:hypothetical protein
MEITGARWSLSGAEALLKLRSLKISAETLMITGNFMKLSSFV